MTYTHYLAKKYSKGGYISRNKNVGLMGSCILKYGNSWQIALYRGHTNVYSQQKFIGVTTAPYFQLTKI